MDTNQWNFDHFVPFCKHDAELVVIKVRFHVPELARTLLAATQASPPVALPFLECAVWCGNAARAAELIRIGCDVNRRQGTGDTCLTLATRKGLLDVAGLRNSRRALGAISWLEERNPLANAIKAKVLWLPAGAIVANKCAAPPDAYLLFHVDRNRGLACCEPGAVAGEATRFLCV